MAQGAFDNRGGVLWCRIPAQNGECISASLSLRDVSCVHIKMEPLKGQTVEVNV